MGKGGTLLLGGVGAADPPDLSAPPFRRASPCSQWPESSHFVGPLPGDLQGYSTAQEGGGLAAAPSNQVCSAPGHLPGWSAPSAVPKAQSSVYQFPWQQL